MASKKPEAYLLKDPGEG